VTDCVEQRRGIRHVCSLIPSLFNTFIDDIINYINKGNLHAPTIGEKKVPGLLFADNLAVLSFTI
jgi:hypothetical protein